MECYQKQGKITSSLATCSELLEAMRPVRQGREHTEASSRFWEMVVEKRVELMALMDLEVVEESKPRPPKSLPDVGPAVLDPAANAPCSQTVAAPVTGDLRLRGTTWQKHLFSSSNEDIFVRNTVFFAVHYYDQIPSLDE